MVSDAPPLMKNILTSGRSSVAAFLSGTTLSKSTSSVMISSFERKFLPGPGQVSATSTSKDTDNMSTKEQSDDLFASVISEGHSNLSPTHLELPNLPATLLHPQKTCLSVEIHPNTQLPAVSCGDSGLTGSVPSGRTMSREREMANISAVDRLQCSKDVSQSSRYVSPKVIN